MWVNIDIKVVLVIELIVNVIEWCNVYNWVLIGLFFECCCWCVLCLLIKWVVSLVGMGVLLVWLIVCLLGSWVYVWWMMCDIDCV